MYTTVLRNSIKKTIALAATVGFALMGYASQVSAAPLNGAIFTTNLACDGVNVNIFAETTEVYLDGGPARQGSAGLNDGSYAVKVTEPNGTLLGTSIGSGNDMPLTVVGGEFVDCYQLASVVVTASDATAGFDLTSNDGGEYKVWVCADTDFISCKTDNFKVAVDAPEEDHVGSISGSKWDDANANAVYEPGELGLAGWTIQLYAADGVTLLDTTLTDVEGDYTFTNLAPGNYVVCEVQQVGWTRAYPLSSDCQEVVVPDQANAHIVDVHFGNYRLGTLIIRKVTVPAADPQEFAFQVTGPDAFSELFSLQDGEQQSMYVMPGNAYAASETLPAGWIQTGATCDNGNSVGAVTTLIGQTVTCTFTNMRLARLIVIKHVINDNNGTKVAAQFTMMASGTNPLPASIPGSETGTVVLIEPGAYNVTEVTDAGYVMTRSADCTGIVAAGETKTCTITNNDRAITRTQGFWSTHTSFTNAIYNMIGGCMQVGSGAHKGCITNQQANGASQLYGAWFSDISKKTNRQTRSGVDHARMILLQQLVAAKLNCRAFICNAQALANIAAADAAYAGNSASAILLSAGVMDAYNNSGDNMSFPNGLPAQGSGTPKVSQRLANKLFWDLP